MSAGHNKQEYSLCIQSIVHDAMWMTLNKYGIRHWYQHAILCTHLLNCVDHVHRCAYSKNLMTIIRLCFPYLLDDSHCQSQWHKFNNCKSHLYSTAAAKHVAHRTRLG